MVKGKRWNASGGIF